jgi:hypothetical protein
VKLSGRLVVTTVGDGFVVGLVEVGDVVVVEDSDEGVEGRAETADVVDGVVVELEVVVSTIMIVESDVVSESGAKPEGLASLVGGIEEAGVCVGVVLSVSDGSEGNDDAAELVEPIVGLVVDVPLSSTSNGDPVPSQYRLTASGPPHTCDASPVHAMLHRSSEICSARPFSRSPQKHSPAYSVPARR